jgi:hypothetical protein
VLRSTDTPRSLLSLVYLALTVALYACSEHDASVGTGIAHATESLITHVVDSANLITIMARPSCEGCVIHLDTVAVLGGHDMYLVEDLRTLGPMVLA